MCYWLKLEDGTVVHVNTGRKTKYCACGRASEFLCDWKIKRDGEKFKTCDKPICAAHAQVVGEDKHLCPLHQKMFDHWKARHPNVDLKKGEQQNLFAEAAA